MRAANNTQHEVEIQILLDGWNTKPYGKMTPELIEKYNEQKTLLKQWETENTSLKLTEKFASVGQRVGINELANNTDADYMFKLDGHCFLSDSFFDEMVEVAQTKENFITPRMYHIDEATWARSKRNLDFCLINNNLKAVWWMTYGHRVKTETVSETMAFLGTAWFCHFDLWRNIGGYDERFGFWGQSGLEFSCKVWLSGYKLLLHKGVFCAHLYREKFPYPMGGGSNKQTARVLRTEVIHNRYPGMIHPFSWLLGKFWPVPSWNQSLLKPEDYHRIENLIESEAKK
jgi:hypothetical protein